MTHSVTIQLWLVIRYRLTDPNCRQRLGQGARAYCWRIGTCWMSARPSVKTGCILRRTRHQNTHTHTQTHTLTYYTSNTRCYSLALGCPWLRSIDPGSINRWVLRCGLGRCSAPRAHSDPMMCRSRLTCRPRREPSEPQVRSRVASRVMWSLKPIQSLRLRHTEVTPDDW